MPSFACTDCGRSFAVPDATLAKYPGWAPKRCLGCSKRSRGAPRAASTPRRAATRASETREQDLSLAEVLERYTTGPKNGVFTDGAAEPNPGPGGWGAVYVIEDQIVSERSGHEPHTTNNRMELVALIAGCAMLPPGTKGVLYTDSQLCVSTIHDWAPRWEAHGWKRKGGEIKNLDLVQELYGVFQSRPELELRWIAAHSGLRWNEYADALATAYRRQER